MDKKTIFLALFFLSLTASLFAQTSVGLEGGLSDNSYHSNIANRAATQLASKVGYSIAIPLRYRVCSWLYAIAAPGLVQKGYSMNRTDSLSGEYDQHSNLYLQLPIGVGLVHEWGRLRVGLELGVYAGYWLSGRVKGNTAEIFGSAGANNSEQFQLTAYNASYSFDAQRDKRWEEGWWVGPAFQYRLTKAWALTAGARYYGALTSQEKAPISPIPAFNRTWIFSAGAAWSLPKPIFRR
jgi:Outer membrane protein beta-barrel domain